jgi:transmembrane sensor
MKESDQDHILDELYKDPLFDKLISREAYVEQEEWQQWFDMYRRYATVSDIARGLYKLKYFERSEMDTNLYQEQVWSAITELIPETTGQRSGGFLIKRIVWNWLSYAAIILALIAVGLWFSKPMYTPLTPHIEYTTANEKRSVTLPDGSTLMLNKHTQISYREDGLGRRLEIDGEAYLHVAKKDKDGERVPFVVTGDGFHVTVLGTRFNVINNKYMKAVALDEGKVSVSQNHESLTLQPGQVVKSEKGRLKRMMIKSNLLNAWQTGILELDNTSLDEITDWLELYRGVEVVNTLPRSLRESTMSGQIDIRDEDNLYHSLSTIYQVEISREGHQILFKEK